MESRMHVILLKFYKTMKTLVRGYLRPRLVALLEPLYKQLRFVANQTSPNDSRSAPLHLQFLLSVHSEKKNTTRLLVDACGLL